MCVCAVLRVCDVSNVHGAHCTPLMCVLCVRVCVSVCLCVSVCVCLCVCDV